MSARIHIERDRGGYVDLLRAYEVVVNGEVRAKLRPGDKAAIEIDPGVAEIFMKIDWCRSRLIRKDLAPGSELRIRCWPRSLFTAFYAVAFARDDYVQVEELAGQP
jgi:hypothetical protein